MPASAVDSLLGELQLASTCSVSAGPIVSVEPRVRKFHQPVTITLPLPPAHRHLASLRLLCSMSGLTVSPPMLRPVGLCGLEAKLFGLGLVVSGLGLFLGLMASGLGLVEISLVVSQVYMTLQAYIT